MWNPKDCPRMAARSEGCGLGWRQELAGLGVWKAQHLARLVLREYSVEQGCSG